MAWRNHRKQQHRHGNVRQQSYQLSKRNGAAASAIGSAIAKRKRWRHHENNGGNAAKKNRQNVMASRHIAAWRCSCAHRRENIGMAAARRKQRKLKANGKIISGENGMNISSSVKMLMAAKSESEEKQKQ